MRKITLIAGLFLCICAQAQKKDNPLRSKDESFLKSEEAARIGDQVLLWQRNTGGWPKNVDMAKPMTDEEKAKVLADKDLTKDSTTDNNATTTQMTFLARLYKATGETKYREGFRKAVEYLLSGQYPNGGWPQFWPEVKVAYAKHITYNDNAMYNTMVLLRDIYEGKEPYDGDLVDKALRKKAKKAFKKGVDCILATQIVRNGEPTVWCQQHDEKTLEPAPARAFELASFCSAESARLLSLLMDIPKPNKKVKRAINGGMKWFDTYKITDMKFHKVDGNAVLEKSPGAKPIWARYYDLENCEPFVCDRDGIPRKSLDEIGAERRNGYAWYTDDPNFLYKKYKKWLDKH